MNPSIKKVMILGCSGSGKTTLAHRLERKLKIPIYHLDSYFKEYNSFSSDAFIEEIENISNKEKWIIDGGYWFTLDYRIAKADLIIYLNTPLLVCLIRILKRNIIEFLKDSKKKRQIKLFYRKIINSIRNALRYFRKRKSNFLKKLPLCSHKVKILYTKKEINQLVKEVNTTYL